MAAAVDHIPDVPADTDWLQVSGANQIFHVFPEPADQVLGGRLAVPRTQDDRPDMLRCTRFRGFDRKPDRKGCRGVSSGISSGQPRDE